MNSQKIISSIESAYLKNNKGALKKFYLEGSKNPSLALILERNIIKQQEKRLCNTPWGYTQFNNFEYKYRKLKEDKDLKSDTKNFWSLFKSMYPKTAVLRTILCRENRINAEKITPKADIFEKNYIWHSWKTYERSGVISDNYLLIKK